MPQAWAPKRGEAVLNLLGREPVPIEVETADAAPRTVTVQGAITVHEGRHQESARLHHAGELGERANPGVRREVDQREPAHHSGRRRVRKRQLTQVGDLVCEVRVFSPRHYYHPGRQIHLRAAPDPGSHLVYLGVPMTLPLHYLLLRDYRAGFT